jgi:autotransporter-associated beta strand protein
LIQSAGSGSASTTAGSGVNLTVTALDGSGAALVGFYQGQSLSFYGLTNSPNNTAPTISDTSGTAKTVTASVGTTNVTLTFVNGVATVSGTANGVLKAYNGTGTAATLNCSDGTATSAGGTGAGGLSVTVNPAASSNLVFTTSSQNIGVGLNSAIITVQRLDHYGNPNTSDANLTVNLTSTSGGGQFLDSTGTTPITSVTITNGYSSVSFKYNDTTLGTPTITASDAAAVLTSVSQLETISSLTWSASPATYNWNTSDADWTGGTGVYADGLGVTFDDTGSATSPINLAGTVSPASIAVNTSSKNYTFSGTGGIGGAATLSKSGTATLTIATANSFSGATTVFGGVVDAQNSTALGGGATTVNSGAAVQVDGSGLSIGEAITLNGTGIASGGALRNLANANTVSGAITLASNSRINSDAGTLSLTGGSIGGATNLTVGGSGNVTIGDTISTTGTLTKDGSGTLTLTANNSYTGNTTVSAGVLSIASSGLVPTGTTIVLNGGDLFGSASFAFPNNIGIGPTSGSTAGTGLIDVASGQTLEVDGIVATAGNSGADNLTLNSGVGNNGTLVLAGANTFSGTTVISNGVLQLANALALQNSTLNYSSGTLDFGTQTAVTLGGLRGTQNLALLNDTPAAVALNVGNNNGNTTYSGALSGTGATLNKVGTGTLTLTGNNTYTGTTTDSAGTLEITNGGAINGGALNGSGFVVDGGSVTSTGTCLFSNFSNAFLESSGTVSLGAVTHPNGDGILIKVTGGSFTAPSLTLNRAAAFTTAPTASAPIAGAITSGFYVNGSTASVSLGSLLIGVNNSSASARLDAGTVAVTGEVLVSRISQGSTRWSILQVNGGSFTSSDTLNGIVIAQNNGGAACDGEVYLSGGVTTAEKIAFGALSDTVGGNGFVILGGGNLYLGSGGIAQSNTTGYVSTIALNSGILGAKADWSSSLPVILGGATIQAADASGAAHNITLGGALSGTALAKSGGGILTLNGANTYSGTTTVSNGTLLVNGSINGSGVDVLTNATLGGAGTIVTSATIESGGTLAPGAGTGAAGTVLTVIGVTLQSGSTNIMQISHNSATNDQVACSTISYGGTLTVTTNAGDAAFASGDKFRLFKATTSYAGTFSATNLPPLSAGLVWSNSLAADGSISVVSNAASAPPAPVAGFGGTPTNGIAPLLVTFTDASTGSITNWVWNFGDGSGVTNSTGVNVNHTYAAGTYTVSLVVNGTGGSGTNTQTGYIVVTPAAPVAGFSGTPTNIFVTQTVTFTDASTGSITNWVWSFGDGTSVTNSTSASVNHAYASVGTDTVSLVVSGPGGSSTNTLVNYIAVVPKPVLGKPVLSGGNLVLSGANGPAGQQYRILSTTNVAQTLSLWTPVYTNTFNADGSYGYTNTATGSKATFLLLVSP